MAKGKDEKNNPKRRVSKEAKGMTTFDMGGGATVQRMLLRVRGVWRTCCEAAA